MKKQKIKILHILKSMDIGGIETYIMNMYRHIDKDIYTFDFLLWENHKSFYEDEIKKIGGNVYKFNFSKNPIINIIRFSQFLKATNYDVVHCHTLFYSGFFALGNYIRNKKNNVFISHVHSKSDNYNNNCIRRIYKKLTRYLILKYSTFYCACSKEAGNYVFGNGQDVIVLKDYINTDSYLYPNVDNLIKIKKELKLTNKIILGNVGRLSIEKNQIFIIELVDNLLKNKYDVKCLFIGDGPERKKLEKIVKEKKIDNHVIFVGNVSNVNDYLNCIDIFLFPSLYEGFGMALLEAQAAGKKCISSDEVPQLTNMDLDLVKYLPLSDMTQWYNEIINVYENGINKKLDKKNIKKQIISKGFDISNSISLMKKIYGGDIDE